MINSIAITDFQPQATDIIWDVRDAKAYAEGHWQPAQHQALESISLATLQTLPSEQTIYVLCREGKLPHFKVGTKLRFKKADIEAICNTTTN